MNKIGIIVVSVFLIISCNRKVDASDIGKMNGYWEIEKVVFPNGKEKKYSINEMYDFFQIKNNSGIRKKVTPVLDGTFLVNSDVEKVTVRKEQETFKVYYATNYSQWNEEIVSLSNEEMVLKNNNATEYHYKRAKPINMVNYGKKTK